MSYPVPVTGLVQLTCTNVQKSYCIIPCVGIGVGGGGSISKLLKFLC